MRGARHDAIRDLLQAQGPLLGLIAVIFGIHLFQGVRTDGWDLPFMAVPAKVVEAWQDLRGGAFTVQDGRAFATLITCSFLHGSVEHVLYNMLMLWIFAALTAELIGHRWMFGIYLFTALTASIFHVALNSESMNPMLGASGAVMGFEGAYLGMAMRWHLPTPHIWPMSRPISPVQLAAVGVVGVFFDYTSLMSPADSNVAYGAHLGGFVGGLVLASLAPLRPRGASVRHH
jgi:membrane associated rhomboid family serine protease